MIRYDTSAASEYLQAIEDSGYGPSVLYKLTFSMGILQKPERRGEAQVRVRMKSLGSGVENPWSPEGHPATQYMIKK